jgi:hypothetical protein
MIKFDVEGFPVETNMDEAKPYTRMYEPTDIESFKGQLMPQVMDVIEQMLINGTTLGDFRRANRMGYIDKRLEPFKWSEGKGHVTVDYTGAMGGDEYWVKISK